MKQLDTYSYPLLGASLIEASAGTGKTYTIVNLYLRLLLGHQSEGLNLTKSDQRQGLGVEQILVVTFTNAATAELKQRIQRRLHSAYLDFYQGHSSDGFIQKLIDDTADMALACETLLLASRQMDEAAIFTIHGFSQRMLSEHAFASGSVFDEQLELDQSTWIQQAVEDFWRSEIVPLSETMVQYVRSIWSGPEPLIKSLRGILEREFIPSKQLTLSHANQLLEQLIDSTNSLKSWWLQHNVSAQLQQAKLKGNTKLGKPDIYRVMDDFCQSDSVICPFDKGWIDFFPEKVEKARSKTSPDLSDLNFKRFELTEMLRHSFVTALRNAVQNTALLQVRKNLEAFKARTSKLSPNDLLTRLNDGLMGENGKTLADLIRKQYPAAMIDEFQDTDHCQLNVFSQVYPLQENPDLSYSLIMIGDPKQAIYGFRGADIYTYIQAKQQIGNEKQFTLATNWRSQQSLVEAVNQLFAKSDKGFLFEQAIPFFPVEAASKSTFLEANENRYASLNFYHLHGAKDVIGNKDAKTDLAGHTANIIVDLLQHGQLNVQTELEQLKRDVVAKDCCVLVRDRNEANLIKQALASRGVDSVFLVRHSVYATETAMDLYRVLDALVNPSDERRIKAALTSELMCFNSVELDQLFTSESAWQQIVELFVTWQQHWQRFGIMMALNRVMQHFHVFTGLMTHFSDGMRRLTDLRHLVEMLQQQSVITPGDNQLLYWLGQQIQQPDHNNEAHQLRLETDGNLVQIITIHASKGLEFPYVFVPFGCSYKPASEALFHDQDFHLTMDFENTPENLEKADFERLAEDTRLLYVALTRAVYNCFVGIWNPALGKNQSVSGLFHTALGKLLSLENIEPTNSFIGQRIQSLAEYGDIGYTAVHIEPEILPYRPDKLTLDTSLAVNIIETPIDANWRITSYSAIARNQFHVEHEQPGTDESETINQLDSTFSAQEVEVELDSAQDNLSRFEFTRGAQAGSFLHGVLENIDFQQPSQLSQVIEQQRSWFGIDEQWNATVEIWLKDVLNTSIVLTHSKNTNTTFTLASLTKDQVCPEMEFHLPLNSVQAAPFNQLINKVFKTSKRQYQFTQLHGMLKGYIDLTFCLDGRFYVADYKSNYLGPDYADYAEDKMQKAMVEHDYHLQSLLYVLALHRFLKSKLADYDYDQHVGGAYYLFLRGMSEHYPGSGIYFYKPEKVIIESLDKLFQGEEIDSFAAPQSTSQEQMDLW
ncbi:exodeoxyribonuclease V subunit beta [Aliiglaciecola sp. 2_MG-2023]|uniref:exodeoxyribonuclease V subunit beta n=1 Tax=unclassified Aliiglaciecola TaxID=2593648 RepID=UPI0026E12253|nr:MULTISPECIES: exodeoxyribonuclease V subunit beta [unclassified Aliiglaciecola]MDO6712325.1 exodeoxyribonuclease V subunit beta [Aliiglaciecola sp. 2_MG-2023]MDO6753269.1 exodeoxyribonuclease V subunit beta [Aliiglaciecola sp. 1_MG-2023]